MKTQKQDTQTNKLDVYVISSNSNFYEDLKHSINDEKSELFKTTINLSYLKTITEKTFSTIRQSSLFFIESNLLIQTNRKKMDVNHASQDIVLLRGENEDEKSINLMKKVIDENILYLLGEIAIDNLTPLLIHYLSLEYIKQKINGSNEKYI